MAKSTGPILAATAITVINRDVLHGQPWDWRVPLAGGLLAAASSLLERAAPEFVIVMSWTLLATVLLTRLDPAVPSPTESIVDWWESIK